MFFKVFLIAAFGLIEMFPNSTALNLCRAYASRLLVMIALFLDESENTFRGNTVSKLLKADTRLSDSAKCLQHQNTSFINGPSIFRSIAVVLIVDPKLIAK